MQEDKANQQDGSKPKPSTAQSKPLHSTEHKSGAGKLFIWVVIILVVGLGVFWVMHQRKNSAGAGAGKGGPGGRGLTGPVPVVAGTVAQKDVPIYLDGLGTVQA